MFLTSSCDHVHLVFYLTNHSCKITQSNPATPLTGSYLVIVVLKVELMGGNISVRSKEKDGSMFSFQLPLRTVQQGPSNPISNDETECLRDGDQEDVTYTDAPGSLHFNTDMSSPRNVPYPLPRPQNRRHKVNYLPLRPEFHTSSGMRFDRWNPATEFLSPMLEMHATMEPSSAVETKLVQYEHCPRPDSSAHLDTQGANLHAAAFQYPKGFDKEDPVKSHHRSNSSSTNRLHGGRVRKSVQHSIRSSPVQGNTRKMEKTQTSEKRAAREPLPAAKVVKYSRPFKILVAEDDPVNVKVATQMMIALGHELKVVNNGADAVQAVQQGTYDVVLMVSKHPIRFYLTR
jgi:CheY-like chemotaxis protein